ncbi:MAG: multidrug ABC transporter permease [Nitrosomonas sp.]
MLSFIKILASFFSFLLVLFFISTILTITSNLPVWLNAMISLALALLSGWFSWQLTSGQRAGKSIAIVGGASIVGGIFFTLVFLGSMAIIKDTSQGPLVGIFIATPLGVILGAIVGYQYATSKI